MKYWLFNDGILISWLIIIPDYRWVIYIIRSVPANSQGFGYCEMVLNQETMMEMVLRIRTLAFKILGE